MTLANSRRARGFTLVELLVVIGVILVLVGIAVYSFSRLDPSEKVTRAALLNVRGMFAELEALAPGEIARVNALPATEHETEIYRSLMRVPANQTALQKMGSKASATSGGVTKLLDGWGNVIQYYPNSLDGASWGLKADGSFTYGPATTPPSVPIRAPNGQPFFASSGPDGKILNADDNMYSYDQ